MASSAKAWLATALKMMIRESSDAFKAYSPARNT